MKTLLYIILVFFLISCFCGCCKKHGCLNQEQNIDPVKIAHLEIQKIPLFKNIPYNKVTIKKLGGWSNFTYLIVLPENKKYVLRLPKKGSSKLKTLINRTTYNECRNSNEAYSLGIGAKVEFFDASSNIFLLKYIENKKTLEATDFKNKKILKEVALLLKKLHSSRVEFNNNINIFLTLKQLYNFFSVTYHKSLPKDLINLMSVVEKVEHIMERLNISQVPCHNDPNPDNFILTSTGIKLVDWEYSGNNDPAWDLALLSVIGEFDSYQDYLMINTYGNNQSHHLFERFIVYKALVQLWRFYWVSFQIDNIDDPIEKQRFLDMSYRRYSDCKNLIRSMEFKAALYKLYNAGLKKSDSN